MKIIPNDYSRLVGTKRVWTSTRPAKGDTIEIKGIVGEKVIYIYPYWRHRHEVFRRSIEDILTYSKDIRYEDVRE